MSSAVKKGGGMRKFALLIIFSSLGFTTQAQEKLETLWRNFPVTMNPDPTFKPYSFEEWRKTVKEEKWQAKQVYPATQTKQDYNCAIIVADNIYSSIQTEITQLVTDLEKEDKTVTVHTASGGTASDLRNYLISISGLEGVLFVGTLPIAWFQLLHIWTDILPLYEDFPCDLYFMDLNGTWTDNYQKSGDNLVPGSDGIFDGHSGSVSPEIFVGRLYPITLGNEGGLLKNYFNKDHNYRTGALTLPDTALLYGDDEYSSYPNAIKPYVQLTYPYCEVVNAPEVTTASNYTNHLNQRKVRAWVSLFAHSSETAHYFYYNSGSQYGTFYCNQIPGIDPDAFFYNLYCCSNARYTSSGYGGGRYIFTNTYGLGAIGSTKTGSMSYQDRFYTPLGNKITIGEAYKQWWTYVLSDGSDDTQQSWHYGMVLLGDPWLNPSGHDYGVSEQPSVITFRLEPITPNPALREVRINYTLPDDAKVEISIYNTAGRVVQTLTNSYQSTGVLISTGAKSITWNRRSTDGNLVPAGIYFCHFRADEFSEIQKIVFLSK